jgi:hypothetical protein
MISSIDRAHFEQDGVVVLKNFYDIETEIVPILRPIREIISICLKKHAIQYTQKPFSVETFDDGYLELLKKDRRIGGEIYDAVKQIPSFMRLLTSEKHEKLVNSVRGTTLSGVVDRGYGIRLDNPSEAEHLTGWHQDYHGQLRSLDGLVLWTPLRAMSNDLGPVRFCLGSQKSGLHPLLCPPTNQHEKNTTLYGTGLRMLDEDKVVSRFEQAAPILEVGDLALVDFLTIHRSSQNRSAQTRWSMQLRWFNFREETGIKMGWPKSYAHGKSFAEWHPELFVTETPDEEQTP